MTKRFSFQFKDGHYTFNDLDKSILKSRKGISLYTDEKSIASLLVRDLNQIYSWKGGEMKLDDSLIYVLMEKIITFNILPERLKDTSRNDLNQIHFFENKFNTEYSFLDELSEVDYLAYDLVGSIFGVLWVDIVSWICSKISTTELIHRGNGIQEVNCSFDAGKESSIFDLSHFKKEKMKIFFNLRRYLDLMRASYYNSFSIKIIRYVIETDKSFKGEYEINRYDNFYWHISRRSAIQKALRLRKATNSYKGIRLYIEYKKSDQNRNEEIIKHFILNGKRMHTDDILTALEKESMILDRAGKIYEKMITTAGDDSYNAVNQFHATIYYFTA